MPPKLIPGTPEHWMDQVCKILNGQANGDVRCMILSRSSTGQFWIHSMIDDPIWRDGMMRHAERIMDYNFGVALERAAEEAEQAKEAENLEELEVKGKPQ